MFSDLVSFGKERTAKQAVGFYLAFLIIYFLMSGPTSYFLFGYPAPDEVVKPFAFWTGIAYCLIVSSLILYQKKRLNDFGSILLVLLSGIGSFAGSVFLGITYAAILTAIDIKKPVSTE